MDDETKPPADPPNLVGKRPFSWDRLLSHIDPSPAEESERFVNMIYEQRRSETTSYGSHHDD